ncbi:MAG: hypothetical protein KDE27_15170 [Planctomycetes bacterium]|nr:hypothetical protein [Planctomycetota bacterium]
MPTYYEERLQKDLSWIQQLVAIVGTAVVNGIDDAVRSVLTLDKDLAAATVLGDLTINRQTRELDRLCHVFVARHLPSAGHLRYVSSVLRLGIALERMGDYATTMSRTAAQLSAPAPQVVAHDLEMMARHAHRMLRDGLRSFDARDAVLARATLTTASQFTQHFDKVFADLVDEGEARTRPVTDLFALMATFNRLERVIHQAKNICEETIFVATGRAKGEKVYELLFVDESNSGASLLAEHFTRKNFPASGRYRSAGWHPAEETDASYVEFAHTVGLDLAESWPKPLAAQREQLDDFHFLVGLGVGARERIGPVPFHTTVLEWPVDVAAPPDAVYRALAPRIRELMEQLRGEQAS